jgi:hypothetical protein
MGAYASINIKEFIICARSWSANAIACVARPEFCCTAIHWVSANAFAELEVPELVAGTLFRVLLASTETFFVDVPEMSSGAFLRFLLASAVHSVKELAMSAYMVARAAYALASVEVPDVVNLFAATCRRRAGTVASACVPVETWRAVFSLEANTFTVGDAPEFVSRTG